MKLGGRLTTVRASAAFACLAAAVAGRSAEPAPESPSKVISAIYTAVAPTLDGRLDEAIWQEAAVIEDLHVVVPIEYGAPSERSRIHVLYGPDALYFAARFYDSVPGGVTALVMRQGDVSWGEDGFSIMLDPFNQGRSGYLFDINPNGVRSQALYKNVTEENWAWQATWQGAASQDDEGWTAEVAIPVKTLSFDPRNETWGIWVMRFASEPCACAQYGLSRDDSSLPSTTSRV